nr:helix-turn-helix domain-containing protein [bacterium]
MNQVLQGELESIQAQTGLSVQITDDRGMVLASVGDERMNASTQVAIGPRSYRVLVSGDQTSAQLVARVVSGALYQRMPLQHILHALLASDNVPEASALLPAAFADGAPRRLILMRAIGQADMVISVWEQAFPPDEGEFTLALTADTAAILRREQDELSAQQAAELVVSSLVGEYLVQATCGISSPVTSPAKWYAAFSQAAQALAVAHGSQAPVTSYDGSRLALFIQQADDQACQAYFTGLGRGMLCTLSEELLQTARIFLRCGLSLADTARALIVHRNTLVYRLDKIRQETGLDLRSFDDAAALEIWFMVRERLERAGMLDKPKGVI